MTLNIPDDELRTVVVTTNASVEINSLESSDRTLELRGVKAVTGQSNIKCADVKVMKDGMMLQSNAGHITAQDFVVDGKDSSGGDTRAEIYSELGQVDVQNASLIECDLQVASGAGTIHITNAERYENSFVVDHHESNSCALVCVALQLSAEAKFKFKAPLVAYPPRMYARTGSTSKMSMAMCMEAVSSQRWGGVAS